MAAIPINLICEKGTDFSATFNIQNEANTTPLNLTGYTAVAKMRRSYTSSTATDFVVGFPDRFNGALSISLENATTAALEARRYVYDILFTDPTDKKSIVIEGNVLATQDVTIDGFGSGGGGSGGAGGGGYAGGAGGDGGSVGGPGPAHGPR